MAGQSKQTLLALMVLSFLNWPFLSRVGMQIWPFPAAVKFPSLRRFPAILNDMVVGSVDCFSGFIEDLTSCLQ